MTDSIVWLGRLATTVQDLAADPDTQQAYLQSLGTPDSPDELALEFEDLYRPLVSRIDELDVPPSVAGKLAGDVPLCGGVSQHRASSASVIMPQ